MLNAFIFSFIFVTAFGGVSGFDPQQKDQPNQRKQPELAIYKAKISDATPVQFNQLTERQRQHSKLFRYYADINKTKISERVARGEGKVLGIHTHIGLGPALTEAVTPQAYFGGIARSSDVVIRGQAIKKDSQITEEGSFIFTDYDIVITEVLKNNESFPVAIGATITVTRPGGKVVVKETIVEATDDLFSPLPIKAQEVVIFLRRIRETGAYQTTQYAGSFVLAGETLRPLTENSFPPGVLQNGTISLQTIRSIAKP